MFRCLERLVVAACKEKVVACVTAFNTILPNDFLFSYLLVLYKVGGGGGGCILMVRLSEALKIWHLHF